MSRPGATRWELVNAALRSIVDVREFTLPEPTPSRFAAHVREVAEWR